MSIPNTKRTPVAQWIRSAFDAGGECFVRVSDHTGSAIYASRITHINDDATWPVVVVYSDGENEHELRLGARGGWYDQYQIIQRVTA